MPNQAIKIKPAEGKLGILLVGLGAVATTFVAGVEAAKNNIRKPIGSFTQLGHIRLGKRTENRQPKVKDFIPLADLKDIVYGAWDLFPDNGYEAARKAGVIPLDLLDQIKDDLTNLHPMTAVYDEAYCRRLKATHFKKETSKVALAQAVMKDIADFKAKTGVARMTMIWCGSTEAYNAQGNVHNSLAAFEAGLKANDPAISPSMIYAYAALKSGVGYANGAPNLTCDCPALLELAQQTGMPLSGKDFKTGQTLMKTIVAPGIAARYIGMTGWFSTNILGNRDGEVLDEPANFKTKEESKLSVLHDILNPELYPDLYGNLYHKVRIEYYPPRRDNKEGWDNIDLVGWLGMPMQLKINFLCRDSILAAPLVLDLVLFMDLAQRAGMKGIQEWLSFYYKAPMVKEGLQPQHNLFTQEMKLQNTLRYMMGEDQITHLGIEYYQD
jgi:myo-inositol-1-phosphate synthase